jgi:hypothetical protein
MSNMSRMPKVGAGAPLMLGNVPPAPACRGSVPGFLSAISPNQEAWASNGCTFAPLINSQRIIKISPTPSTNNLLAMCA